MEKFTYLSRQNAEYVEDLFTQYLNNPDQVDPDWQQFFEGVEFAKKIQQSPSLSAKEMQVYDLIRAYRDLGHLQADLNPLAPPTPEPALQLKAFGLTEKDLDNTFTIGSLINKPKATLREIRDHLETSYCKTLAVEFAGMHAKIREWVLKEFEHSEFKLSNEEKKRTCEELIKTETLEKFFHTRYVGGKRFSIEGADALIPMLESLALGGSAIGVEELVIGMAHRGRINVLANFMDKAINVIFSEFDGLYDPDTSHGDGDVKYHMGFSADKKTPHGNCHISLAYNPSHLEGVDPVVTGMVRAKQRILKDNQERKKIIPLLIHGDAAFAAQGIVSETMQLSVLPGYTVGGTIHIVIDNQVGFTTSPEYARSSYYCTDIAKLIESPVLHVNADDVEATLRATDIALRFRQTFGRDIVIHLVCYRRHGHNEGDEPAFTQPKLYQKIKNHPTVATLYKNKLLKECVIESDVTAQFYKKKMSNLQEALDVSRSQGVAPQPYQMQGVWSQYNWATPSDLFKEIKTSVEKEDLKEIGTILTTYPDHFTPHKKIIRLLGNRQKMLEEGKIDWGLGELLAFGTLLKEKIPVRLSGQDSTRGTFSHRHALWHDVETGERFNPFAVLESDQANIGLHDSPLSEAAVLGFEFGNSSTDPRVLSLWEAQFGDFANGAQVIIDQFLASGESKWSRMSGLTLLLPHGYEGQGPEHSSARLERFLQLCAEGNMQVANLTTPAQIFHILRRQVKRSFRKPLVIMTPKSLLRHPKAISTLDELTNKTFCEILADEQIVDPEKVNRIIFCSGKFYYELSEARNNITQSEKIAIIRLEQIYPFADHMILEELKKFKNAKQILWAQEEPKNMGAYSFVAPKLNEISKKILPNSTFHYVGRTERASPAVGNHKLHDEEQSHIIQTCLK